MPDLLGAYERIRRVYRLYIESAFPLRSAALTAERNELLARMGTPDAPGTLAQPPLLEPIPVYESSGLTLRQASDQLPAEYRDLQHLARELFRPTDQLYRHQVEALRAAVAGEDVVATTGTGSGKTECFLLPLLADLARDSRTWPSSPNPADPEARNWWNRMPGGGARPRVGQWEHHPTRPFALRAIILYPLNALVEDQLRRLRRSLESQDVQSWMDRQRGGNRILFGRYTGQTPISGRRFRVDNNGNLVPNHNAIGRLRRRLREIAQESAAIANQFGHLPAEEREPLYYFPTMDGGEMWSRWDMQETPPDVLITNYCMLNIMLMRALEDPIFRKTREWLEQDPHRKDLKKPPTRRFFLIVDELHAYRGTPGTEVSYILRLLLDRLGLALDSRQLVILATSASVEDNADSREFLREFFGRDRFRIISGRQQLPEGAPRTRMGAYAGAFAQFASRIQQDPYVPMTAPDPDAPQHAQAMAELASALQYNGTETSPRTRLGDALLRQEVHEALRDACAEHSDRAFGRREVRPTAVPALDAILFPGVPRPTGTSTTMRGLLLALGMSLRPGTRGSPQPVRGHLFFHNLQNLWACCNPSCTHSLCQPHRRQEDAAGGQPVTVGSLHAQHQLTCSCGSRVLDLIVCEVCGEVFLGGFRKYPRAQGEAEILTADQPNLEDMPDRVGNSRTHGQYAVFWPIHRVELPGTPWNATQPQAPNYQTQGLQCHWIRAVLQVFSGELVRNPPSEDVNEVPGYLFHIGGNHPDAAPMPAICPRCDADYRNRQFLPTPLRNHRTGFQRACQVLASAACREMPLYRDNRPARKLVIFSDSRQDAAKLSAGMERDHYRDMVRLALVAALNHYWDRFRAFVRQRAQFPGLRDRLQVFPQIQAILDTHPQVHDATLAAEFQSANVNLVNEFTNWVFNLPPLSQEWRRELETLLGRYPGLVPLRELRASAYQELLRLGIPPGGTAYRLLGYWIDQARHDWHECFNWPLDLAQLPTLRAQLPPPGAESA